MLLRRAWPAARQNLAHSFPICEMGSSRLVGCWFVIAGDTLSLQDFVNAIECR
jgi:hypothetical protein